MNTMEAWLTSPSVTAAISSNSSGNRPQNSRLWLPSRAKRQAPPPSTEGTKAASEPKRFVLRWGLAMTEDGRGRQAQQDGEDPAVAILTRRRIKVIAQGSHAENCQRCGLKGSAKPKCETTKPSRSSKTSEVAAELASAECNAAASTAARASHR